MLGRLCRWLRFLGYDCLYPEVMDDGDLLRLGEEEGRLILTRDKGLAARGNSTRVLLIRSDRLEVQLAQVVLELGLDDRMALTRCGVCNGILGDAGGEAALAPPDVREKGKPVRRCPGCGRVYWWGSHTDRIRAAIDRALGRPLKT